MREVGGARLRRLTERLALVHDHVMAGDAALETYLSYDDYLALERDTDHRYEWFDGHVYAMAGGTPVHGNLSAMMIGELLRLALPCGCRVYSSDVKIRVSKTGLATYPDVSVVCGPTERDPHDKNAIANPSILVEVLSDATEAYDRGEKFDQYRRLPSLRDYVLVSQHRQLVEVFSRDAQNRWVLMTAGPGESLPLTAIEGSIEVDRVYAGVELTPAPPRPLVE